MSEEELDIKIKAVNERMFDDSESAPEKQAFVDYYDQNRREHLQASKIGSYGVRPYTKTIMKRLSTSPVVDAYKQAKDEAEYLEKTGDIQRAQLVRAQYMEDYYMPAVDAAVRLGSKRDVVNSRDILNLLDNLVLIKGVNPSGYTKSLVLSLYDDTNSPTQSDIEVQQAVEKIRRFCDEGDISKAISIAGRIKDNIQNGNNIAIPEDYEIIQKVAIRG